MKTGKKVIGLFLALLLIVPELLIGSFAAYSTSIVFDKKYFGSITASEEGDIYCFEITKSGGIKLNIYAAPGTRYSLFFYNKAFKEIKSFGDYIAEDGDGTFEVFLEAGVYYFEIKKWFDYTGDYSFVVELIESGSSTSNYSGSFEQAQNLQLNGMVKGVVAVDEKSDFCTFSFTESGRLDITLTTQIRWYTLRLYNQKKEQICAWGDVIAENAGEKTYTLYLEAGKYYVELMPWEYDRGLYSIETKFIFSGAENSAFSGSFEQAQNLQVDGITKGVVAIDEKCEFYTFTLPQADSLDITLTTQIRWYTLRLYNQKKEQIYAWGDAIAESAGKNTYNLQLKEGKYYLEFEPWDNYKGFYEINVESLLNSSTGEEYERVFCENTYVADIWLSNRSDISKSAENVYLDYMLAYNGDFSAEMFSELENDSVFKAAYNTRTGMEIVFDPGTGATKMNLDKVKIYQALLGDLITYILNNEAYSESFVISANKSAKTLEEIMSAGVSVGKVKYSLDDYKNIQNDCKNGGTVWTEYLKNTFEEYGKKHKQIGGFDDFLSGAGMLLQGVNIVTDFIKALGIYLDAMLLSEEMWDAIAEIKNNTSSEDLSVAISRLQNVSGQQSIAKAILLSIGDASTDVTVFLTDAFLEPIYDAIPGYREARAIYKATSAVCDLVFATNDVVNAYLLLKATGELCTATKAAVVSLANAYKSTGSEETAGVFIAAVEILFNAVKVDLDSSASAINVAYNKGLVSYARKLGNEILSWFGFEKDDTYGDFVEANKSLMEAKENMFSFFEVNWVLNENYLKKDYPDIYSEYATKTLQKFKGFTPQVVSTRLTYDRGVELRFADSPLMQTFATGFYIKESAGNRETEKITPEISKSVCYKDTDSLTVFPKEYTVSSYTGSFSEGIFSPASVKKFEHPLKKPIVSLFIGTGDLVNERSVGIFDTTSSYYDDIIYHIYRSYDNKNLTEIATVKRNTFFVFSANMYVDKSFDKTKNPYYYVKSEMKLSDGRSVFSELSTGVGINTDFAKSKLNVFVSDNRNAPRTFALTRAVTNNTSVPGIEISWDKVKGASGYEIYRAEKYSDAYEVIANVESGLSYTDNLVQQGTEYKYFVASYQKNGSAKVYLNKSDDKTVEYEVIENNEPVTLSCIEICTRPLKTVYKVGEKFDPTGLSIKLVYSDGTKKTVTSGFKVSELDSSITASRCVDVTYGGFSASVWVEVINPIAIDVLLDYTITDNVLMVTVYANNAKGLEICELDMAYNSSILNCTKTVGYETPKVSMTSVNGKYAENIIRLCTVFIEKCKEDKLKLCDLYFDIKDNGQDTFKFDIIGKVNRGDFSEEEFIEKEKPVILSGIEINKMPTKLTYKTGEKFDPTGMVIKLIYSDGSVKTINSGFSVSELDSSVAGEKSIKVSYGGFSKTLTVSVINLTGDVDGNGKITAADARLVLRASVGLEKFSTVQTTAGDIDKNKKITAADARYILRASVGLEKLK